MLSPTTTFPRLTASEEADIILEDIFQYDAEGMNAVLTQLCEDNGIAFDWYPNGEEVEILIIENEDELIAMYQSYLKVEDVAVAADEEPEIIEPGEPEQEIDEEFGQL